MAEVGTGRDSYACYLGRHGVCNGKVEPFVLGSMKRVNCGCVCHAKKKSFLACKICGLRVGLVAAPNALNGTSWRHFTSRKVSPPHKPIPVQREAEHG